MLNERLAQAVKDEKFLRRFWAKVDVKGPDECWLWKAALHKGYGVVGYGPFRNSRVLRAPRVAWVLAHGPIKNGLHVLHDCPGGDNRACVNTAHLFLGTNLDNVNDKALKGRTPCGKNHVRAVLTEDAVRKIRLRAKRGETHESIARTFSVNRETVSKIVRRERWKHVA